MGMTSASGSLDCFAATHEPHVPCQEDAIVWMAQDEVVVLKKGWDKIIIILRCQGPDKKWAWLMCCKAPGTHD